jgi:hypothetical protein
VPYSRTLDALAAPIQPFTQLSPTFVQVNSAAKYLCLYWTAEASKTLATIKVGTYNISGTQTNIFSWNLYAANANGTPTGGSLASGTATPASFSGISLTCTQALTAGNMYCLVISNAHGTPASNYWDFAPTAFAPVAGSGILFSSDTGANYYDRYANAPPLQFTYGDATRYGAPAAIGYSQSNQSYAQLYSTSGVYLGLIGNRFRPQTRRWIHEVSAAIRLTGTFASAGALECRIYKGTTLIGTSNNTVTHTATSAGNPTHWRFTNGVLVEPGSDYTVAICQNAATGGTSSHYYTLTGIATAGVPSNPTTTLDGWYEGWHTVYSTASALSAWTASTAGQAWMSLLCRTAANRGQF